MEFEIEALDLRKEYPIGEEKVIALNGVELHFQFGEFAAITGTSGSGKSTLLHMLGGLDRPTTGRIYIAGKEITAMKDEQLADMRRDYIGFVFQKFCLVQELNVRENILFPALLKNRNIDSEYFDYLVQELGLSERLQHIPSELSGGQQQRVAIARALINKPRVILCDEPTGNLDKNTSQEVINLLMKLNRELGHTLIMVTHDNGIAERADRIIRLEDGRIINITTKKKTDKEEAL